jgi:Phage integrase family
MLSQSKMGLATDPYFVFHACRLACATRLVQANVNLRIIRRFMGHERIETTIRHAQLSDTMLQGALDRMQKLFPSAPQQDIGILRLAAGEQNLRPSGAKGGGPGKGIEVQAFDNKGKSKAGVVKLADTQDLGSCGLVPWGFKSLRPHHAWPNDSKDTDGRRRGRCKGELWQCR